METHKQKPLRLAFIGMSGAGKTFWSRRLATSGCAAISCDAGLRSTLWELVYEQTHWHPSGSDAMASRKPPIKSRVTTPGWSCGLVNWPRL